jgi:hypothetical protein
MEDPRLAQLPSQIDSAKCLVLEVGLPNCSSAHKHKFLGRPADFSSLKPDLCYGISVAEMEIAMRNAPVGIPSALRVCRY